jgi:hypothetical protein
MAKGTKTEAKAAKPEAGKKSKSTVRDAGKKMAETLQSAGANMREAASDAAQNSAKINLAVIDQVEANTRAAFAALRAAAGAKTITDVVSVQRDYVKEQGERSVKQAREIGDLIAQFGRSAVSQLTGRKK